MKVPYHSNCLYHLNAKFRQSEGEVFKYFCKYFSILIRNFRNLAQAISPQIKYEIIVSEASVGVGWELGAVSLI